MIKRGKLSLKKNQSLARNFFALTYPAYIFSFYNNSYIRVSVHTIRKPQNTFVLMWRNKKMKKKKCMYRVSFANNQYIRKKNEIFHFSTNESTCCAVAVLFHYAFILCILRSLACNQCLGFEFFWYKIFVNACTYTILYLLQADREENLF